LSKIVIEEAKEGKKQKKGRSKRRMKNLGEKNPASIVR